MNTLAHVERYLNEGWAVLPIPKGEKGPRIEGWQKTTFGLKDFKPDDNIGIRLGEPSNGLTDSDLDHPIAIVVARMLLLKTQRIHGRPSKPESHYWYIAHGSKPEQFKDLSNAVLVEIRSTGQQTVVPGSVHPSGEELRWEIDREPNVVDAAGLRASVAAVATATLLAQHWPGEGSRHACAGLVAGFLASLKLDPASIPYIVEAAARAAGDLAEIEDRVKYARNSVLKFKANAPTAGGPKLEELVGADVVKRIRQWYGSTISRIDELNEKHAAIFTQGGKFVVLSEEMEDGKLQARLSDPSVMPLLYPEMVAVGPANKAGNVPKKKLGSIWLDHPSRRSYRGIEMAPNGRANPGYYNLWRGFAVEPKLGCWDLYKQHILLLANGNPDHAKYIIEWMAETVQHPDQPIGIALSFRGDQGTGKSTFARFFGKLFGPHFLQLDSDRQLLGQFNGHLQDAILVLADEAVWASGKMGLGALKRIITEQTIQIERKGIDAISVRNMMHVIVASNSSWFVPVASDNRRFAVFEVSSAERLNRKFFGAVEKELDEGGASAMLYDLLNYELGQVDLYAIPETGELSDQKYFSMEPKTQWWYEVLQSGALWEDAETHGINGDIRIERSVIYQKYTQDMGTAHRLKSNGMEEELGKFFVTMLPDHYPGRKKSGPKRWWVFPSLDVCRAFFAKKHGAVAWETSETSGLQFEAGDEY